MKTAPILAAASGEKTTSGIIGRERPTPSPFPHPPAFTPPPTPHTTPARRRHLSGVPDAPRVGAPEALLVAPPRIVPDRGKPGRRLGFGQSRPRLHSGQHPHNSISRQPPTSVASRRDAIKGGTHKLPENKVALFIDFDNIGIGIRQHFVAKLHPQNMLNKA